jgi:hypothetical protein
MMARPQNHSRIPNRALRPAFGKFGLRPIIALALTFAGGPMLLAQGEPAAQKPVSTVVLAGHALLDDATAKIIRFSDIKIKDYDPSTGVLQVPSAAGILPVHLSQPTIQVMSSVVGAGANPALPLLPNLPPWIKPVAAAPLMAPATKTAESPSPAPNPLNPDAGLKPNQSAVLAADIGDDFANSYIELGSIKASDVTLSAKLAQIPVNGRKITVPLSDATVSAISALGNDRTDGQYTLFSGSTASGPAVLTTAAAQAELLRCGMQHQGVVPHA